MSKAMVRWGSKKAFIAEYGEHYSDLFCEGDKWIVTAEDADGNQYTPEVHTTKKSAYSDAHAVAKEIGATVLFVG